MGEKILYKIRITGWVQGVGFRWSALKEARILGINGFVRNLPDGSVYIEAEGSHDQLNSFVEWCKEGPVHGKVESVIVNTSDPVNYTDFQIEH
jgi:acylphosphatase